MCAPQEGFNLGGGKLETPLPLPPGVTRVPIPEKGYIVQELASDVYFVTDGFYNVMFAVTDDGVVQCDAPPSMGDKPRRAIAEVTSKPVTHFVYSHGHADHTANAASFALPGVTFVGTAALQAELEDAGDPGRLPPTLVVESGAVFTAGGVDVRLTSLAGAHDATSTLIEVPKAAVVMLVDLVVPGWAPARCDAAACAPLRGDSMCVWCTWRPPRRVQALCNHHRREGAPARARVRARGGVGLLRGRPL